MDALYQIEEVHFSKFVEFLNHKRMLDFFKYFLGIC